MNENQFNKIDAQDETSRLAQVGPEEQDPAEFDAWQKACEWEDNLIYGSGE